MSSGSYIGRPLSLVAETGDLLCNVLDAGETLRVAVVNVESGAVAPVLDNARLLGHTASGHLLVERDGVLLAAAFDAATRRAGPAVPVLDRFAYDDGKIFPQVAVSANGTLVYVPEASSGLRTLAWVQADGTLTPVGELPAGADAVDLHPDGRLAVLNLRTTPIRAVLWDMVRHVPAGLDIEGVYPRWHPDGRHIALIRNDAVLLVDVDDGSETTLATAVGARTPSFTADGETIVFVGRGPSGTLDILALLPGDATPRPIVATGVEEHSPALSPDGRWVAWVENPAGFRAGGAGTNVYIARFPSGAGRRRVTTRRGYEPLWRQDGRALFVKETVGDLDSQQTALRVVEIGAGDTLDLGTPRSLFDVDGPELSFISATFVDQGATYWANPDGSRFLMVYRQRPSPLTELVIVQNWFTELHRLVPRN